MTEFDPEQLIITRLLKELEDRPTVILGPGIPQLVRPHLPSGIHLIRPGNNGNPGLTASLAVLEAAEVSDSGDLALPPGVQLGDIHADHWIVATRHTREDGQLKFVRSCRLPVYRWHCVEKIITELGVLEISSVGFELKELAPGIASDDVKSRAAASIHVADDIKLML